MGLGVFRLGEHLQGFVFIWDVCMGLWHTLLFVVLLFSFSGCLASMIVVLACCLVGGF